NENVRDLTKKMDSILFNQFIVSGLKRIKKNGEELLNQLIPILTRSKSDVAIMKWKTLLDSSRLFDVIIHSAQNCIQMNKQYLNKKMEVCEKSQSNPLFGKVSSIFSNNTTNLDYIILILCQYIANNEASNSNACLRKFIHHSIAESDKNKLNKA